jgi:hypothetical protein
LRKLFFVWNLTRDAVPGLGVLDGLFVGFAKKHIAIANSAVTNLGGRCRAKFHPIFRTPEAESRIAIAYRELRFHVTYQTIEKPSRRIGEYTTGAGTILRPSAL